jgi:hypothetical protein
MVIEIPSKSNGDIRLRNCLSGEIVACAADGILWKRDSFFGEHSLSDQFAAPPVLVREVPKHIYRR